MSDSRKDCPWKCRASDEECLCLAADALKSPVSLPVGEQLREVNWKDDLYSDFNTTVSIGKAWRAVREEEDRKHLLDVQIPRCMEILIKRFPLDQHGVNDELDEVCSAIHQAAERLRAIPAIEGPLRERIAALEGMLREIARDRGYLPNPALLMDIARQALAGERP